MLDEPLSVHYLPIKSQNCQERLLQVEHFTPSIPDALYRLLEASEARVFAERKILIFWVKKSWHFHLSLSLLRSFFFILVPFFGPGNLVGLISVGNVLGKSRLTRLEGRKCRRIVENFHHHFRVNVTHFLSFYPDSLT